MDNNIENSDISQDMQESYRETFVGEKYQKYYQSRFYQINNKNGFNVAAFFLGIFWLLYRKMYLYSFVFFALFILYCFIPTSSSVDRGIAIGITIGMGAGGNGIYKNFVDQKIKKIISLQPNNLEQELREQGGTDFYSPLGLLIVVIVLYWIGHNFA